MPNEYQMTKCPKNLLDIWTLVSILLFKNHQTMGSNRAVIPAPILIGIDSTKNPGLVPS
jgi:hypothetical protein